MKDKAEVRIVVLGDSITKGDQVGPEARFTALVEKELSDRLGRKIAVVNSGVNADITRMAVDRVERDVIAHRPDYGVIMFGVNDAGFYRPDTPDKPGDTPRVSAGDFRKYLNMIADKIASCGAAAVLATPVPMSKHYWLANLPQYVQCGLNYIVDEYAEIVRDAAHRRSAPLADVHRAFRSRPETEDFIPDGIHPDKRGHRLIADVYLDVFLRLLRRNGG